MLRAFSRSAVVWFVAAAGMACSPCACALLVGDADGHALLGDAGPQGSSFAGQPIVLARGEQEPHAIVVTPGALYWTEAISGKQIRTLALSADAGAIGTPATFSTMGDLLPADMLGDAAGLWVLVSKPPTTTGAFCNVDVIPFSGGDGTCIGIGPSASPGFTMDDSTIYLSTISYGRDAGIFSGLTMQPPALAMEPNWSTVYIMTSLPSLLASNGADVYFAQTGSIYEIPTAGGTSPKLFAERPGNITGLAVDQANVYWTTSGGEVDALAREKPGSNPTELASSQNQPFRMTSDADDLYWTNQGTAGMNDGSVVMVAKTGGPVQTLASGQASPWGIAVDARGVYWTDVGNGTVMMVRR